MKLVTGARTIYIKIAPCNLRNHKLPTRLSEIISRAKQNCETCREWRGCSK